MAPPDRHLTVGAGRLALGRGPKENGVRPAVDPMLRSLAAAYGEHSRGRRPVRARSATAASERLAVKRAGGTVIVQDPEDATVPSMPESAIAAVGDVDDVLTAEQIGPALQRLAGSASPTRDEPVMAGVATRIVRRVRRRGSRVPSATARCGRPPRAISCATAAGWATPTPRTR